MSTSAIGPVRTVSAVHATVLPCENPNRRQSQNVNPASTSHIATATGAAPPDTVTPNILATSANAPATAGIPISTFAA